MYPSITDGLILTGFSPDGEYLPATIASWDLKVAALDQPLRFGGGQLNITGSLSQIIQRYNLLDLPADLDLMKVLNIIMPLISSSGANFNMTSIPGYNHTSTGSTTLTLPTTGMIQNLSYGYLTWSDIGSNQYAFTTPPFYDPAIGVFSELTKQPVTMGEILSLNNPPPPAAAFTGPVQIITGNEDFIYCGGNCTATMGKAASIPAMASVAFPKSSKFEAYIQPNTGHAINVHYNATAAYKVMNDFLKANGL
jgi:hypothetical protein